VFIAFFFYRDGVSVTTKLNKAVKRIVGDRTNHLLTVVGNTIKSVVYGIIGTAIAQGILAGLGFWVAGIPFAFLLGLLTFLLALIPAGPPFIWVPAAIYLFYKGQIAWGVFMAIWGFFVISGVDNVLKPYLISRGSNLPFMLVFLGVLGGVIAFGFIGIFLGPTLLAVGYALMDEWSEDKIERRHA
jgi:predicted PurR-regulated permease PerM